MIRKAVTFPGCSSIGRSSIDLKRHRQETEAIAFAEDPFYRSVLRGRHPG